MKQPTVKTNTTTAICKSERESVVGLMYATFLLVTVFRQCRCWASSRNQNRCGPWIPCAWVACTIVGSWRDVNPRCFAVGGKVLRYRCVYLQYSATRLQLKNWKWRVQSSWTNRIHLLGVAQCNKTRPDLARWGKMKMGPAVVNELATLVFVWNSRVCFIEVVLSYAV